MAIQQLDLGGALDAQTPLATIAALSRQRGLQDQEQQQNALQLQRLAQQIKESKQKADDETAVKKIISDGGDPQDVYKKLLAVNPDTARTYLTNSQADIKQAQDQALLRAHTLEGQVAPEVSAPTPQTTSSPIRTSLSDPSQMSQPQVSAPATQQVATPLPSVEVPFIGQPSTRIQPQSQQQLTLAQRAQAEFNARLEAQKKLSEPITTPEGAVTTIPVGPEGKPVVIQGQAKKSDIEKEADPWIAQNPTTNGHPSTLADYVDHKSTIGAQSGEYGQELAAFNASPALTKQFGSGPMGLTAKKQADQLKLHAGEAAQTAAATAALQQGAVKNVQPHLVVPATEAYAKDSKAYAATAQAADDMNTFVADARAGNKVAYSFLPAEGALYLTTSRGVKRINLNEMNAYGGGGSAWDRINAWIGKQSSGASIPANILNDMEAVNKGVAQNARTAYQRNVDITNQSFGSTFKPIDFSSNSPSSGITVTDPKGGQHVFQTQAQADAFKKAAGIP